MTKLTVSFETDSNVTDELQHAAKTLVVEALNCLLQNTHEPFSDAELRLFDMLLDSATEETLEDFSALPKKPWEDPKRDQKAGGLDAVYVVTLPTACRILSAGTGKDVRPETHWVRCTAEMTAEHRPYALLRLEAFSRSKGDL